MPDGHVSAETNWILDVVLQQDAAAVRIFELVVAGELVVYVPVASLAEAVKRIEHMQKDLRDLRVMLERRKTELRRGQATDRFARSLESAEAELGEAEAEVIDRFWNQMQVIAHHARVLALDEQALALAQDLSALLELTPADALVLASVALNAGECSHFVSRDRKAFDRPEVTAYLDQFGITYHRDSAHYLNTLSHT